MAVEGGVGREVGEKEGAQDPLPLPLVAEVRVAVGWAVRVPEGVSVGVGSTGV